MQVAGVIVMTDLELMKIKKILNCMVNNQVSLVYQQDRLFTPEEVSAQIIKARASIYEQIKGINDTEEEADEADDESEVII